MQHIKYDRFLKVLLLLNVLIILFLSLTGCSKSESKSEQKYKISIAQQYGLAYAPLQIVKELKLLEKNLPGVEVTWKQLANTAAIREAMLAGDLDVGFMAIPPFLIGRDKGMEWKIACGLSSCPVGLVTNKDSIESLSDFTDADRIALPQPGSIQHILLAMACEKLFKDPHKLDNILVTMAHPDGMNALLAGSAVTAHFTTLPYLSKELEVKGMREILDGKEAMGEEFTFIVGVTTYKFHDDNQDVYNALLKSLNEAVIYMRDNPEDTASILAEAYEMQQSEVLKYLTNKDMIYSLDVNGLDTFARFMQKIGYIENVPLEAKDIMWEDNPYE
ncbi:MAG: ABC transporter substrate-binding protein [Eubacteriales bacterium]